MQPPIVPRKRGLSGTAVALIILAVAAPVVLIVAVCSYGVLATGAQEREEEAIARSEVRVTTCTRRDDGTLVAELLAENPSSDLREYRITVEFDVGLAYADTEVARFAVAPREARSMTVTGRGPRNGTVYCEITKAGLD